MQKIRSGKLCAGDVPEPMLSGPEVLVVTQLSAISVGTEKLMMQFASKSLIDTAKTRPEQVCLFPGGDQNAFNKAVHDVLQDLPQQRTKIARVRFDKNAQEVVKIYEQLLS